MKKLKKSQESPPSRAIARDRTVIRKAKPVYRGYTWINADDFEIP